MALSMTTLTDYLDEKQWGYTVNEEKTYVSLPMNMKTVDRCTMVMDLIDPTTVLFYAVFPIKAPEERRAAVGEFLHRANFGLCHGNYEMDYRDGEIRYKTSLMVDPEYDPEGNVFDRLVNLAFQMIDRFAPGILSVIYANDNPVDAIAKLQPKPQQPAGDA